MALWWILMVDINGGYHLIYLQYSVYKTGTNMKHFNTLLNLIELQNVFNIVQRQKKSKLQCFEWRTSVEWAALKLHDLANKTGFKLKSRRTCAIPGLVNIQKTMENHHVYPFFTGKSTISMAIFNSKL